MGEWITSGQAARILELSAARVRELDHVLRPTLDPATGHRRYLRADVEAIAAERRARRQA
jgi:hypothetical protein